MEELTTEQRIDKEERRLLKLYRNIPKNKLTLVRGLIQNAAFMAITLADLQAAINEKGCVEIYQHGANQFGNKATTESQTYNTMIKNYSGIILQLDKMLPDEKKESSLAKLMNE